MQEPEPAQEECGACVLQEFGRFVCSFFSLIAGVMVSAPPSQPGEELVGCQQVENSLKWQKLLNKEIASGRGREQSLFLTKAYSPVLLSVWEAGRELEGGGMGRQSEAAREE